MSSELDKIQELLSGVTDGTLIYNKYQRSDFEVGDDNLNPVRELDQGLSAKLDDLKVSIYAAYKDRIEALFDSDLKDSTGAGVASDLGIPYADRTKISSPVTMQESTANTGSSPSLEDDLIGLLGAIEPLLGGEALSNDGLPFDFCNNRDGDLFGSKGGAGDSGTGSGSDSGSGSGNSSSGGAGSGANTSNTPGLSGPGVDNSRAAAECLQLELQLLAILFAILNIIKVLLAVERYVMAILMPIIQIITLICSAWLNPAAIAEVIQRFAGMGVAMAIDAILSVIQMIIDSLNLDCLVNASMSAMSQLMGSVSGIKDAASDLRSFVDFSNPESSLVMREVASTWALAKEAASTSPEESAARYKEAFSQIGPDIIDNQITPQVDAAKGAVASTKNKATTITKSAESVVKDYFGDGYETN